MPIKVFSDEERAAIKADAGTRFQGQCLIVNLAEPINETIVLAPFDRKSYSDYSDAEDLDPQSAYSKALMGRLLWPDLVALNGINQRWPALAEDVARALAREAGGYTPTASCELLDLDALPDGLSAAAARDLFNDAIKANTGNLWAVTLKDGSASFVLQTPDPHTWIAARACYDDAKRKGRGCIDAIDPYVQAAVVWSSEPIVGILAARPALIWNLWTAYKRAGGEGAAVRTARF